MHNVNHASRSQLLHSNRAAVSRRLRRSAAPIGRRRRGIVGLYLLMMMTVMIGFVSFAVDWGQMQMVKTQLLRAGDAAARAGAASLMQGTAAAQSAAVTFAADNTANGSPVTLTASTDVQVGWWNYTSRTFAVNAAPMSAPAGSYPAIRVYARRTKATGNAISLTFASIIGISSCDVTTVSVAALVTAAGSSTNYVSANSNPWLAGANSGTLASVPDPNYPSASGSHNWEFDVAGTYGGTDSNKVKSTDLSKNEPYGSPFEYDVTPGTILTINVPMTSANMAGNAGGTPYAYADGSGGGGFAIYNDDAASYPTGTDDDGYYPPSDYNLTSPPGYTGVGNSGSASDAQGSEHGMSNIAAPLNSVIGVFLDAKVPDTEDSSVPPGLDYSSQTERDTLSTEPLARQTFYVGNGLTSTLVQKTVVVPAGVSRMYLGTMDGHEWSNNTGGYNATITAYQIELVQ